MPTKDDLEAQKSYIALMEEAKLRALSLNTATNNPTGLPFPLVREYCFLQLRMLCELIGLACLVAHGDMPVTKTPALQKAYKPDEIFKKLESLHPTFYPVPVHVEFNSGGMHMTERRPDFLTKADLLKLYGRCGDVLHRGSLKNLLSAKKNFRPDYKEVNDAGQKILNLLSAHRIIRVGGNFVIIAFLQGQSGQVEVALAEAPAQDEA